MSIHTYGLARHVHLTPAMRRLALLCLVAACDAACPEEALPASSTIRRGVFVEGGGSLAVASSPAGSVVRENCDAGLNLLGPELTTRQTVDLDYKLEDGRAILALARSADGTIAAVMWQQEYVGDIDEIAETSLVLVGPTGNVMWKRQLDTDAASVSPVARVAIGPAHVFLLEESSTLSAYSRATGDIAWQRSVETGGIAATPVIVANDSGGVAVAAPHGEVVMFDGEGAVRWSLMPDALGVTRLDHIAAAPNGTVAVSGLTDVPAERDLRIALIDDGGQLLWGHTFPGGATSIASLVTDGTSVIAAGSFIGSLSFDASTQNDANTDGFLVSLDATDVHWVRTAGGEGVQRAQVFALPDTGSMIVGLTSHANDRAPQIQFGDVSLVGYGLAILDMKRP